MKLARIRQFSNPQKSNSHSLPNTRRKWLQGKNLKIELATPYPTYTIKQKEFTKPRPAREYTRFPKTKVALSGMDVSGNLLEFIHKDIIKPLIRPTLYEEYDIKSSKNINEGSTSGPNPQTKWALKSAARAPNYEYLPKIQPFQTYYFPPQYNNKNPEKYRNFSLKTDHIGIKVPRIQKVKSDESFLKLKREYCISTETRKEDKWVPFPSKDSINNLSSKNYDIINFQPILANSSNCQIMNKTLNDRKKGIGEYADLTKTFRINFNKNFAEKYNNNPFRFHKFTGIFSNMYDASHKNGNIIPPFGHSKKH
jgi:hypothetical protein